MSRSWQASSAGASLMPAARSDMVTHQGREAALRGGLGWLPGISLVSALGLLCLSATDRLSAAGVQGLEPWFWLSLLMIAAPTVVRLLAVRAGRTERLGLALVFGLSLYFVKVLQSPFAFTYGDEFMHLFNTNQLFASAHLFGSNSILPASTLYPGLESVTVALMRLTGLDTFSAGLTIIGLARLVMVLALFLLYEQLTGSARVASLGCVFYAANPNFLFWSAQFSYESIALPLAVLALYCVARRESGRWPAQRIGLTLAALVITAALVVTHHLASYFLVAALCGWALVIWLQRLGAGQHLAGWLERVQASARQLRLSQLFARVVGRSAWPAPRAGAATGGPSGLALFALVAVLFWLTYVASLTLNYLSPVFGKAVLALLQTASGEEAGRTLFQTAAGAVAAPVVERVVGITSVLLSLLGLPFGLRQVWRRTIQHPLMWLLAGAAVAYFAMLALRFVPAAWEIANRSSEFLFIGLALVLAMARLPGRLNLRRLLWPALTAVILVILAGGVIAGWPQSLRLTQVYEVSAGGQRLEPVGLTVARWVEANLGPDHNFIADESNGRFLLAYGDENVLIGRNRDVQNVLQQPGLSADDIAVIRDTHTEYMLVDRRIISGDNMAGYFFDQGGAWPLPDEQLWPHAAYTKFDGLPPLSRLMDGGNVVVYDVRKITGGLAQP